MVYITKHNVDLPRNFTQRKKEVQRSKRLKEYKQILAKKARKERFESRNGELVKNASIKIGQSRAKIWQILTGI